MPTDDAGNRVRQAPWDIRIEGTTYEVKTATEGKGKSFQFNHIRYHRTYDALLCIGIAPDDVQFDAWSKADVATRKAGHLVAMDKGTAATFKLSKRIHRLRPIDQFRDHILDLAQTK